jgi:hypothetical protein
MAEQRTRRTYTQFMVAWGCCWGCCCCTWGGPDDVQLQLETLDQDLYSELYWQLDIGACTHCSMASWEGMQVSGIL